MALLIASAEPCTSDLIIIFNSAVDFKKYPRSLVKDIKLLKKTKIQYLYIPNKKDIYTHRIRTPIYLDKFSN